MNSYAVIFTYSFDSDVAVYLFDTFEDAQIFMLNSLKEEYRIDTEENGYDAYFSVSEDGDYARLVTQFYDHDDVTEFRIGRVYQ